MVFHILTIFPHIFDSYFKEGIIKRALELKKMIDIKVYDLRDYTADKHRKVDDTPYGGGPGMVLKVEPIYNCIEKIKSEIPNSKQIRILLFSAKGEKYNQAKAKSLAEYEHVIMICGRYEGVDERVAEHIADEEISIGDYILTGGEIPAMVVVDSVSRLIPGILGNPDSLSCETYDSEETDYPVYTKPEKFEDWEVPDVLISGNHAEIEKWRNKMRKKTNNSD